MPAVDGIYPAAEVLCSGIRITCPVDETGYLALGKIEYCLYIAGKILSGRCICFQLLPAVGQFAIVSLSGVFLHSFCCSTFLKNFCVKFFAIFGCKYICLNTVSIEFVNFK